MKIKSGEKYGGLLYEGPDYEGKTRDVIELKCNCGRLKKVRIYNLLNGSTKRCGLCNSITLKKGDVFGKLSYLGPTIELPKGSKRKIEVKCDCGRHKDIKLVNLINGLSTSCNECNHILLKSGENYGKIKYIGSDIYIGRSSHKKLSFECECGRLHITELQYLNDTSSCGKCANVILENGEKYVNFKYFGERIEISPYSNKKLSFECRCGTIKNISVQYITKNQKSCGSCRNQVFGWYQNNADLLKNGVPIDGMLPIGGPIVLEKIKNASVPFLAQCCVCGKQYNPRYKDIKRGLSLTCGCTQNKTSSYSLLISDYLSSLNIIHFLEYKVNGYFYDVYIPSANLLIEINGLYWHSSTLVSNLDALKYKTACEGNYDFMMIYEDEIINKFNLVKALVFNRIKSKSFVSLRPSQCVMKRVDNHGLKELLNNHHYLGTCTFKIGYGVFYEGMLIAGITFSRPTRQSSYDWELTRMVSDSKYKVHGIWSKLCGLFIREINPKSMVSFSDNRLFSGLVYSKIGFKYDGNVRPDYYWVKGKNRYHKSRLRKKKGEVGTENELRISQGYRKIMDLGKKRWILNVT